MSGGAGRNRPHGNLGDLKVAPGRSRAAAAAFRDYSNALCTLLIDARAELDADDYPQFVELGLDVFGYEGARLVVGEALRVTRQSSAEAA